MVHRYTIFSFERSGDERSRLQNVRVTKGRFGKKGPDAKDPYLTLFPKIGEIT
jgi:hypothetical protein